MTGSIATLIIRRIAREAGIVMPVLRFTAIGSAVLPAQLAVGTIGLRLVGALH